MLNRPPFWLGLFLGASTAFRLRFLASRSQRFLPVPLRHLLADAVTVCDSSGTIIEANAAAEMLFGLTCTAYPALRYPTGQPVPPGQHPLRRASLRQETVSGIYHLTTPNGSARILDISAQPLPKGKAVAAFRDITGQYEKEEWDQAEQVRQTIVRTLCRRLSLAQNAEAMGQVVAEETAALLSAMPSVQVRLYRFDPHMDTLTCLASAPDDRPKRPKSAAARPATVRFDAQIPELWQMYVARKPSQTGLPLISGGVTIGHLSVTSPTSDVFEDPAVREALELIASLAALALAGPPAAVQTAALTAQAAALREIAAAIHSGVGHRDLADMVTKAVKRLTLAEVCTLSTPIGGKLCVMGKVFEDDLLSLQTAPNDPRLLSKATQKAWKTQKLIVHLGVPNPAFEAGPWRAFAGSAGFHSVIALPLGDKRGVLTVYTQGERPLPDSQIKFLETVAVLVSLSPMIATGQEDRAGL